MKIRNSFLTFAVMVISPLVGDGNANAGLASTAVREVAEQLFEKGGREVVDESAESITRELESVAEKYGPSGVEAARKGGPTAFRYLVEGGEKGPKIVKLFEKYGDSAIHIVSRPKSMAVFIKYGDDAAAAMIRHPGIAEDLIEASGAPAARALSVVGPQNARRLAMLAEDGTLTTSGRSTEILDVITRYGDKAMDFIWRNKGALTVGATLAAFLEKPEAFIDGGVALTKAVATPAVEKAGDAAIAVAHKNPVAISAALIGSAAVIYVVRRFQKRRVTA
jgi:hypothetical protein